MAEKETELQAMHALVGKLHEPRLISVAGCDTPEKLSVLLAPQGFNVHDLEKHLAPLRANPRRRQGTVDMHDLDSLVLICDRFKDGGSVVFADARDSTITAVFNYHPAGGDSEPGMVPRFCDHRAVYSLPLSKEWKAWQAKNGHGMSQSDFAQFIEDRIADVIAPDLDLSDGPTGQAWNGGEGMTPQQQLRYLSDLLGGTFAAPNRLLELSRGLAVKEGVQVKGFTNLTSGESQIEYTTEHTDGDGRPLKVPNLFLLAIPVFESGSLWRIAVRLRYRIAGGRVNWFYSMYRPEKVFDAAFDECVATVAEKTGLVVYRGDPDGNGKGD